MTITIVIQTNTSTRHIINIQTRDNSITTINNKTITGYVSYGVVGDDCVVAVCVDSIVAVCYGVFCDGAVVCRVNVNSR